MSQQIIETVRAGKLSPNELMAVDDHLASCAECRELIGASFAATGSPERFERAITGGTNHLTYGELEAYVDRILPTDDAGRIEDHVRVCDNCHTQLRELQSFVTVSPVPEAQRVGWFSSLGSILIRPIPVLAGVVVLIAIGSVIWLSRPLDDVATITETSPAAEPEHTTSVTAPVAPEAEPVPSPMNLALEDELAVSINDGGGTVGILRSGELSGYRSIPGPYRMLIKNALRTGKAAVPDLSELSAQSGVLMGGDSAGTFRLTSPIGKVVDTDTPTFKWQSVPGAASYVVEVFDRDFHKVASSGELKNTSWKHRLNRGKIYSWQVTATKDGEVLKAPQRPQPDARFRVLDRKTADELSTLRRSNPRSHLLLGVAYANAGLVEDAIREFEMLSRQNPRSDLPKTLLRQLKSAR